MKLFKFIIAALVLAFVAPAVSAENWLMFVKAENGWSAKDGDITVTYSLDKNPVKTGGYLNINCCSPILIAKVKNNSDDFIYLDLGKTYILRNGEAQLFQNIATMSTTKDDKEDESTKKSLAQSVMPVPPHSTKTLNFPLFASDENGALSGYEPFIKNSKTGYVYNTPFYCDALGKKDLGKVLTYDSENSPVIATISIAYTTTEGAEKPTRITNNFYVDKAAFLKSSKDKEIGKAGLADEMESRYSFIIWGLFGN